MRSKFYINRNIPELIEKWESKHIDNIIEQKIKENKYIEYKKILRKEDNNRDWIQKLEREFAAFANASGGYILFGIKEENDFPKKSGIEDESDIDKYIMNIVKDSSPKIETDQKFIYLSEDSDYGVLVVKIHESIRKPVTCSDSSHYIRIKSSKVPIDKDELFSLIVSENNKQKSLNKLEYQIEKFYNLMNKFEYYGIDSNTNRTYKDDMALLNAVNVKELRESILKSELQKENKIRNIIMQIEDSIQDLIYFKNKTQKKTHKEKSGLGAKDNQIVEVLIKLCFYITKLQRKIDLDIKTNVPKNLMVHYKKRLKKKLELNKEEFMTSYISEYRNYVLKEIMEDVSFKNIEMSNINNKQDIITKIPRLHNIDDISYEDFEKQIYVDKEITQKDSMNGIGGPIKYTTSCYIRAYIKFSGDRDLLKYKPQDNSRFNNLDYDYMTDTTIVKDFKVNINLEDEKISVKEDVEKWINNMENYIKWLDNHIDKINNNVINEIVDLFETAKNTNHIAENKI